MVTFEVNDMTCGHCVGAIIKAVASVDPSANVQAELAAHRVHVASNVSSVGALSDAIAQAGFTPVAVAGASTQTDKAVSRKGCCCG